VPIHFVITFFITGAAFDFIAHRTRRAALGAASYYNLLLTAFSRPPVLATGFHAWEIAAGTVSRSAGLAPAFCLGSFFLRFDLNDLVHSFQGQASGEAGPFSLSPARGAAGCSVSGPYSLGRFSGLTL
jgi:hypothetical protein